MSGTTISNGYTSGVTLTQAADNPVLVTGTVTVGSGIALYGAGGIDWTLTNAGLLRSAGAGASGGYGVSLSAGGSVANQSGGTIYGYQGGVRITGGGGTVTNAGTIAGSGSGADAVGLAAGFANTVVVMPGASFVGMVDGGNTLDATVVSTLELASAVGAGTLAGLGTQFTDFGQVAIDPGATWTLTADAVGAGYVIYDAGTLTNAGSIGSAVTLGTGAALTNAENATITGNYAAFGAGGDVTVTNAGSFGGAIFGVLLPSGGLAINLLGGTITAGAAFGNGIQLANTVMNDGLISAPGYGVFGASAVYNQTGGTIVAGHGGANLVSGSLVNAGTIDADGTYGIGILLQSNGAVTNQSGGFITASGLGINMSSGAGTVVNDGLISATDYGVARAASVTNQDKGTITGAKGGLNLSAGSVANAGSIGGTGEGSNGILLQNGGSVSNASGGIITGSAFGVDVSAGGGTLENAGFIGGAVDAVSFGAGFTNQLIVDPGAIFSGTVDGGAGSSSTLELASGGPGTLAGLGSQYVDFTQITVDAGASWTLTGNNTIGVGVTLSGAGTVTLAAGATLEIAGTVASGETIVFGGSGAELVVDSSASMAGSVANFAQGETIDLRNVAPASVSYNVGGGMLDYSAPGGSTAFPLTTGASGGVQAVSDGAGGADVTALCFCAGTLLATPGGEVPVERLAVGGTVLTASGATRPIVWIGVGHVLAARARRSAATPVIVRKGALADNVPHYDLHVTKGHALWFDGVLIPVEFLVNHRSILWDDRAQEVALYHIELDCHDVLLANGAPAESYRDDGNRWLFSNANSGWGLPTLVPCAPVLTGGDVVDTVWRRLLDRAGPRPGVPLTNDPDLHLLVDGERVDVAWQRGAARLFRLPARPRCVRVVSRIGVPQELGWARDPRPLGVALRFVVLRQAARLVVVEAEDARLALGFHRFEQDVGVRWTDGDGVLPAALFEGFSGAVELELHLGGTTWYLADAMVLAA